MKQRFSASIWQEGEWVIAQCVQVDVASQGATEDEALDNLRDALDRNPEKMSGTPVFSGTRVPIKHLFDYLEGGESLEEFLDQFPTVSREQAVAVLSASRESLLNMPTDTQARMELMSQAANDELFLADLNATMEDFKDADHLEHPQ